MTSMTVDELVTDYLRLKLPRPETAKAYRSRGRSVVKRLDVRLISEINVEHAVLYRDALLLDLAPAMRLQIPNHYLQAA